MPLPESDLDEIISTYKNSFAQLKQANILITGGTGYIGKWLLESLFHANEAYDLNASISVVTRNTARFISQHPHLGKNSAIHFTEGDVRNFSIPAQKYTHCIHAATDVIAENAALETYRVITEGTAHVLEQCRQNDIKDILFLSSGAVYGPISNDILLVPESYNGRPPLNMSLSAYGVGKLSAEWLCNEYSTTYGMNCKIARIFAQIGPYLALNKQFAAGNFLDNILNKQPIIIKGDGTPLRSYMYGTDMAGWLWKILTDGKKSQSYNVGSNIPVSIYELARKIADIAGIQSPDIQVLTPPDNTRKRQQYVPDTSLAASELDLKIHVPLDESIKRTLKWLQQS